MTASYKNDSARDRAVLLRLQTGPMTVDRLARCMRISKADIGRALQALHDAKKVTSAKDGGLTIWTMVSDADVSEVADDADHSDDARSGSTSLRKRRLTPAEDDFDELDMAEGYL